jgi:hypothetical protein
MWPLPQHLVEERDGLYAPCPAELALLGYCANSIAHLLRAWARTSPDVSIRATPRKTARKALDFALTGEVHPVFRIRSVLTHGQYFAQTGRRQGNSGENAHGKAQYQWQDA